MRHPNAAQIRRDANRRLEVLHELVALLLASEEPQAVFDRLYQPLCELLQLDFYFHFAPAEPRWQLAAYGGMTNEAADRLRGMSFDESVWGAVAAQRRTVVLSDVQNRTDPMTDFLRTQGVAAYVGLPLIAHGNLLGLLSFGTKSRHRLDDADIVLIRSVSDQVAIALERARAAQQLRCSEERLRIALDAGHMGVFEWDLRNRSLVWDTALRRLFGYGQGPVDEQRFWALVHPNDRSILQQLVDHQLNVLGAEYLEVEFRIVRPDGAVRWIAGRSRVARDREGRPQRINGINFDITERREAELALRHSETRFRRLGESEILGMAFFDVDGRLNDANDTFLAMIGYSRAELRAGYVRWDRLTPPEWMPRTRKALEELRDTGRIAPYEKEYFRRDGTKFWVLVAGAEVDGRSGGIALALDIDERKRTEKALQQSEDRFRQAFDYAPIGMALSDLRGKFLHVNRAHCAIVGYAAQELLQPGFDSQRLLHPDDSKRHAEEMRRLIGGEIPAFFLEMRYLRREGDVVWVRASATVRHDPDGRPVQVVGLVEDITQRRQAEEALREADRHKDDFLAALGHELRNPLAPIRNAMQILRFQQRHDPKIQWAAEVTERQVQQMARLVDDLLDVSRINRGQLELREEIVDMAEIIAGSLEMTAPLIESRRHRIDFRAPPAPVRVRGDRVRLTQVLANLLNNAAKYTPPHGQIRVTLEAGADAALICVRDSGIGIPPTALRDIFEPFRQLRSPDARDQTSLGLGLALVKRLVRLHGGSVEARSKGEGTGSEFRIGLPFAPGAAGAEGARAAVAQTPPSEALRIVVADDNRDAAESLGELLRVLGHQTFAVFSGTEAVESVRRLRPDVVICDIGLPDITGYEVAARLRGDPETRAVRLVALTGYGRGQDQVAQAGFDEWLLKPAEMASLERVLHRH